jgi:hypothetical protein
MSALTGSHVDLRRYPRVRVAWKVIVELPGGRPRMRRTIDLTPFGAKVRLESAPRAGADARLSLSTPERTPLRINAIVWRSDPEGSVFVFVGVSRDDFRRLKLLLDAYRGA